MNTDYLKLAAYEMRLDILKMSLNCGKQKSHMGGCLSVVEILDVLYLHKSNLKKAASGEIPWEQRDRLVLSKGQAGIAVYAGLHRLGILTQDDINGTLCGQGAKISKISKRNTDFAVECTSGSLGMGLGFGIGLCEVFRHRSTKQQVYVLLGDGECGEGSVWEGVMYAGHRGLDNLTVIVDCNGLQLDGATEDILSMSKLSDRFRAFGFVTVECDGHSVEALSEAFDTPHVGKPLAIIAKTVKGKGVPFAENQVVWHANELTEDQYKLAFNQISAEMEKFMGDRKLENPVCPVFSPDYSTTPMSYPGKIDIGPNRIETFKHKSINELIGESIKELTSQDDNLAFLFSDCSKRVGLNELNGKSSGIFYQMGISEQNLVSVAAGMASEGMNVFACAYANFITGRVIDQIRVNLGIVGLNVKLIGIFAGFMSGDLGYTHVATEDVAFLRSIPGITICEPADKLELLKIIDSSYRSQESVYIRITAPLTDKPSLCGLSNFEIGKARIVRDGSNTVIIVAGSMLSEVLKAADLLEKKGLSCKVVEMNTFSPIDTNALDDCMQYNTVFTVEEHSVTGGLGSAVCEYYASFRNKPRVIRIGAKGHYKDADYPDKLRAFNGLTADEIAKQVLSENSSCF